MRPRVHRYQAARLRSLSAALTRLPPRPLRNEDAGAYTKARSELREGVSLAMKHAMRAETYTRRGDRLSAAQEWRGFRRALLRANLFLGCARIMTEVEE